MFENCQWEFVMERSVLVYNSYMRCLCFMVCPFCVSIYSQYTLQGSDLIFTEISWMSAMYEQIELKPNCGVLLCDGCGILLSLLWPTMNVVYSKRPLRPRFMTDVTAGNVCGWRKRKELIWRNKWWMIHPWYSILLTRFGHASLRINQPWLRRSTISLQSAVTIVFLFLGSVSLFSASNTTISQFESYP